MAGFITGSSASSPAWTPASWCEAWSCWAWFAFLPFPVRLLSDYHDQRAAVVIYMATFFAASLVQRLLWGYATGRQQLLSRPVDDQLRRRYNLALAMMPLGFGALIPIALLTPRVAIAIWLLALPAAVLARLLRG